MDVRQRKEANGALVKRQWHTREEGPTPDQQRQRPERTDQGEGLGAHLRGWTLLVCHFTSMYS